MPYDPDRHHRRSIRLKDHDYTAGVYFVTICVRGRLRLFGAVCGGAMRLSDAGRMVADEWQALPLRFPTVALDAFVVMPDHFHAVVALAPAPAPPARLGDVVGAFKSRSTGAYIAGVRDAAWPPFDRQLWLRDYYGHIVRGPADLARIRAYIERNPARWHERNLSRAAAYHHAEGAATPDR